MKTERVIAGHQSSLKSGRHERSERTILLIGFCIALLTLALACQQTLPDTRAADESALRELDTQWSTAAGAKDVDKTVSYYADDVMVLPPNGPMVTNKPAIRELWQSLLTAPGFSGGWQANKIEVARSGDLAYLSGTWEFTMNDTDGNPATDRGKFVEVFKKQTNGEWKCVSDIWNSDLPLPTPPGKQ
jgi:ketosteroid isomerase-like protein